MGIADGELQVGDRVVYPNQGVCRVVGTTEMEISGHRETFVKLAREDDEGTVMVPKGRLEMVGVRRVADAFALDEVFAFLAAPVEGPELDWKVRHRSHTERIAQGGLMGLAQVVKGLTTLADLRPLPPKERELYDTARHLLVSEVAAAAGLSDVSAEDAVDLTLFPPGVERRKPPVAVAVAPDEDEDEVPLDDPLLSDGTGLDAPGEEGASADVEESEEPKAAPPRKPKAVPAGKKAPAAKAVKSKRPTASKPAAKPKDKPTSKRKAKPAAKPKAKSAAKPKAKSAAKSKAAAGTSKLKAKK